MTALSTGYVVSQLRQGPFLYRRPNDMQRSIWFGEELPVEIPVGNSINHAWRRSIPIPAREWPGRAAPMQAWMSFRLPRSPRYADATACIALHPRQPVSDIVTIDWLEPPTTETDDSLFVYGLDGDDRIIDSLCAGLVAGLQTDLGSSFGNMDIQVLTTIVHRVDSYPRAFEELGQWLMEALGTKMAI